MWVKYRQYLCLWKFRCWTQISNNLIQKSMTRILKLWFQTTKKTNFTLGWEEQIYQRVLAPKGFSLRYISYFSLLDKYLGPSIFSSETSINHVKIVFHAIYTFFLIGIKYKDSSYTFLHLVRSKQQKVNHSIFLFTLGLESFWYKWIWIWYNIFKLLDSHPNILNC